MKADLLIKNGMVVDPARNFEQVGDVAIKDGKIVDAGLPGLQADRVIDADGCLVLPGLIDFHAHVYTGSEVGINANYACLPQGVTAVIDAGTAGLANYENFVRTTVAFNDVRVFSLINVSPAGLPTLRYHEDVNPKHYDMNALKALFVKHPGQLLGLKVRQSKDIVGEMGLEPLKAAVKVAGQIGCPVVVHVTDPPCSLDKLADELRPKDIFCHVFQGTGSTIIGEDGKVLPGIKVARERGVIFDASNGKGHFSFAVARAAIADGFLPDVISTDLTVLTMYMDYAFGLPYLMSKYLSLGVKVMDVAAACTSTPANLMGLKGVLGTVAPGALADVAIFRHTRRPVQFKDTPGEIFTGDQLLISQMTVLGGRIVYRQIDFGT